MSAEGHSNQSNQRILLLVKMTVPHNADFAVETGKSYSLQGKMIRLEGEDTITFHVERGVNNQVILGPKLVDLGPVKGTQYDSIRVWYLILVEDLDVPVNTVFCLGSRIYLGGHIISLGLGEAAMTVQVTAGAYFERCCREFF
ncbi:hypothetical protein PSHT_06279 [Puccinia striiformis]|uniref:Uncharacterized protein n=1 Tax=Puccinia striiformis TaxID=27350 RepID=A0A2S4W7L0_9BASI|nr:hypothetical protein PSHT_06279 [Puccinia striiformis]